MGDYMKLEIQGRALCGLHFIHKIWGHFLEKQNSLEHTRQTFWASANLFFQKTLEILESRY